MNNVADVVETHCPEQWGRHPMARVDVARYISPHHARLEKERLWPHVWQMACREEELSEVGAYLEYEIAGQSIILVRAAPDKIKGFFNACLHRGTQLVKGCGVAKHLTCPFHAWRWSLHGHLEYVHDRLDFPGLKAENLNLPECQVDCWAGFVFVKLSPGGPSLQDYLRPVADHLAPYKMEDYQIQSWRTTIVNANWKVVLEAFEESYHVTGTHPQVLTTMDDVNVSYDCFGPHSRMIASNGKPSPRFLGNISEQQVLEEMIDSLLDVELVGAEQAKALKLMKEQPLPQGKTARQFFSDLVKQGYGDVLPDIPVERYLDIWDYTLFPNFVFNATPGDIFGFTTRPYGDDPDKCIFDVISLHHPGHAEPAPRTKRQFIPHAEADVWGFALGQDMRNFARVQAGMHSSRMKEILLAGYQEMRIVNRHNHIDDYYARFGDR